MIKENLVFYLTNNEEYSNKLTTNDSYGLVSNKMLNDEIKALCEKSVLHMATKINDIPLGQTIYLFRANVDDEDYNNNPVSSVKIIIKNEYLELNKKNIKYLNIYTSNIKKLNVYKTCHKIFTVEKINDNPIKGYSIGTYSSSKDTKEFVFVESKLKDNPNWNNYVIYDDHQQYNEEYNNNLEKTYALKN